MSTESRKPNPSYVGAREDLLSLVPAGCRRVINVGCAEGATGAKLKERARDTNVTGIEFDERMAAVARERLDRVIVADATVALTKLAAAGEEFDLVFCGDVLEHLTDPWETLRTIRKICPDGYLIVRLPNVAHISTIRTLVFDHYWPYRERGIHDRTHLRFSAGKTLTSCLIKPASKSSTASITIG